MNILFRVRAALVGVMLGACVAVPATRDIEKMSFVTFGAAAASPASGGTQAGSSRRANVFGDFDGDGLEDLIEQSSSMTNTVTIRLGTITGEFGEPIQRIDDGYLGVAWSNSRSTIVTGDFNGDGRDDLFVQGTGQDASGFVLYAGGNGRFEALGSLVPSDHLGFSWSNAEIEIVAGDFNGDSRDEVLLQAQRPDGLFYVILSMEAGLFAAHGQGWIEDFLGRRWAARDTGLFSGDFNGDGRDDLLLQPLTSAREDRPDDGLFALVLANERGRFARVDAMWAADEFGAEWDPSTHRIRIGDFDRDGVDDVWLHSSKAGGFDYLMLGTPMGFTHAVAKWNDGVHARTAYARVHAMQVTEERLQITTDDPGQVEQSSFGGAAALSAFVPTVHGTQVVGSLTGQPGVSGGSASYSVNVAVPPGRNGMQPAVSLNYSSRGGNGELGIGWSLSAGSSVHRCAAISDTEGFGASVTYEATRDRLCLDGQKLIAVEGTYGGTGTLYRTELDSQVLVKQSGALSGTSVSFSVRHKDGRIAHYGQGSNSPFASNTNTVFSAQNRTGTLLTTPIAWGLGRIEDRHGNRIYFSYITPSANSGEYHLAEIRYTGDANWVGDRSVLFTWEARNDVASSYQGGGRTPQTKRLQKIQTKVGAEVVREYYLGYQYGGATGRSLLSSIEECAVKSGATSCFVPTVFDWRADAPTYASAPISIADLPTGNGSLLEPYCDVDGDGRREMIFMGTDANGAAVNDMVWVSGSRELLHREPLTYTPMGMVSGCRIADFNNDGRGDSIGSASGLLVIAVLTGNPMGSGTHTDVISTNIPMVSGTDFAALVMDLDGDGLEDIVQGSTTSSQGRVLKFWRNTGALTAFANEGVIYDIAETEGPHYLTNSVGTQAYEDVNGDGRMDILLTEPLSGGGTRKRFLINTTSTGGGTPTFLLRTSSQLGISPTLENVFHMFADLNGDGASDLLYVHNSNHRWFIQYNRGAGTTTTSLGLLFGVAIDTQSTAGLACTGLNCNATPFQPKWAANMRFGDVDGDGRPELLYPGSFVSQYCMEVWDDSDPNEPDSVEICGAGFYTSSLAGPESDHSIYRWNAISFKESGAYNSVTVTDTQTAFQGTGAQGVQLGDMFGDGLTDAFYFVPNDGNGYYKTNPPNLRGTYLTAPVVPSTTDANLLFPAPDFVIGVTDGMGRQARWEHAPLSVVPPRRAGEIDAPAYYTALTFSTSGYIDAKHHSVGMEMYAVERFLVSHGADTADCAGGPDCTEGFNTVRYSYGEGVVNTKGRGFQGFKEIIEDDLSASSRTVTIFSQKFPNAGNVKSVTTLALSEPLGSTNTLSQSENTWTCLDSTTSATSCLTTGLGTFVPFLEKNVERRFEIGAYSTPQWMSTVDNTASTTSSKLAGCPSLRKLKTEDAFYTTESETELTALTHDESLNWWLCKVDAQVTRVVSQTCSTQPCPTGQTIAAAGSSSTTTYAYTAQRKVDLETTTVASVGQSVVRVNDYAYDAYGNVSSLIASGSSAGVAATARTTTTVFDSVGFFPQTITRISSPTNHVTTLGYSARHGELTMKREPNLVTTSMTHDAFGRESTSVVSSSAGSLPTRTTVNSSCPAGCDGESLARSKVVVTQAGTPDSTSWFDEHGRALRASTAGFDGSLWTRTTKYDSRGRTIETSEPFSGSAGAHFTRVLQFDLLSRPTLVQDPRLNSTSFIYSGLETVSTLTPSDAGSARTSHRWTDGLGRLVQTRDPLGSDTHFRYDAFGNPVLIQDVAGNQIKATFNAAGHKLAIADPDQGSSTYAYNAFGELTGSLDAKNQQAIINLDLLGRMTSRIEGAEVATWTWDSVANGVGALGQSLLTISGAPAHKEDFEYDAFGRQKKLTTTIDSGTPNLVETSFDALGRVDTVTYPQGIVSLPRFASQYGYTATGYLASVKEPGAPTPIWAATAMDARGNLLGETFLNDVSTTRVFDPASGIVATIDSTRAGAPVQDLEFTWDSLGNLRTRSDGSCIETFTHDLLNRVRTGAVSSCATASTLDVDYNLIGNITTKAGVGTAYAYGAKPHAVSSITGGPVALAYTYDANGNMETRDRGGMVSNVQWNHANLPTSIQGNGESAQFRYAASRARFWQQSTYSTRTETTLYVGSLFERMTRSDTGAIEYRHYVKAGGQTVATVEESGTTRAFRYMHRDHLGGVDAVTDAAGAVVRSSFDAHGNRRDAANWSQLQKWSAQAAAIDAQRDKTVRGFTDHEMLDNVSLVHMNGRVYDPEIGRFMSVDPVFQFPENTQSLNPYSYVLNNPLSLTDPTGEFAMVIPLAIAAYNLYSSAQSVADAAVVVSDDTATLTQKAMAVGEAVAAVVDVTPGDAVRNSVNAIRQVAKGAEKAAAKEAGEKAAKSGRDAAKPTASNGAKDTQGEKPSAKSDDGAPAERGNSSSTSGSDTGGSPSVSMSDPQAAKVKKFEKTVPANAKDSVEVKQGPGDTVVAQATSAAKNIPGSKAVYEKQVAGDGKTVQYTKTTYDSDGSIVHVKDKITDDEFHK